MIFNLHNKHAVICGSTQGIGLAIAKAFADAGASCTLIARSEEKLNAALQQLTTNAGQQHQFEVADFADVASVKGAIDRIVQKRPVHILVNNTGGPKPGPIIDATTDTFLDGFSQHLLCNQVLLQSVLPGMKQAGYGRIINIVSTSVRIPLDNLGVSNTIRAAVAGWAKTVSNEVAQFGVTVNNILPGLTETQRLDSLLATTARNRQVDVTVIEAEMKKSIPARRFGKAEEIAAVAVFLASPAAAYVNGISMPVDGGRTGSI